MKRALAILAMMALCADASAGCISSSEVASLRVQALIFGSVKLFISHAGLPLGTSVESIQAATAQHVANLNSGATLVYLTQSWVPPPAPGFEAYVTSAGVQRLYAEGYCFGKIN